MEFSCSAKQSEQLAVFENLVRDYGIVLHINAPLPCEIKETVSLDVEHDEMGGYIGIGVYLSRINSHYWFSDIHVLTHSDFSTLSIVAHNGVSDFDLMRFWGFNVDDKQLVYDTMLLGHILDSSLKTYGLKDMVFRDCNIRYPSYDDIVGKRTAKQSTERVTLDKQPSRVVQLYNCMDCYSTAKEMEYQLGRLY